ncbi:ABC transporter permease subunit [Rhodoblastus sp.]|uniref:ABC transporter permease n=1 Tax=Rhodoblastus sp. TaxID=1962975 RepID=UPI00261BC3A2|nr:ABC transporter permease subunit [Rhodoblastus sp.]
MTNLLLTARLDVAESLRARWFLLYSVVFGGLVALLMIFGLTESQVMGFTGLTRLLMTYIQLSMAILPIFILISTVRSVASDREAGVFEYMLSLPVSVGSWYWGRFAGRFVTIFAPVFLAMAGAVAWGALSGLPIPWKHFFIYSALLLSLSICFLGLGFLISTLARSADVAQSAAFMLWLVLVLFLDLLLLGLMLQERMSPDVIIGISLINPLQVFRTAAMALFDPQLVLLGPAAFTILDRVGANAYLVWACLYPALIGLIAAAAGFWRFKSSDLL